MSWGLGTGGTVQHRHARRYCSGIAILNAVADIRDMDRAVAIANEFLRKPGGSALTQMQLQKLVYISHGWTLGLMGQPLTVEEPQAWNYGPVYRDLYDHTKFFGSAPIGRAITPDDDEAARFFLNQPSGAPPYQARLTDQERAIVDTVWTKYGTLSGSSLSSKTHQPLTPWSITYDGGRGKNRTITNELIKQHYVDLAAHG